MIFNWWAYDGAVQQLKLHCAEAGPSHTSCVLQAVERALWSVPWAWHYVAIQVYGLHWKFA